MATVATELHGDIHIPDGITNLTAFCDWVDTAELPEKLSVHFLRGEVWVDLGMEEMFSHNQVKAAVDLAVGGLIRTEDLGLYVPDGMQLANEYADIATDPDAMFLSHATIEVKRVRFTAGKKRGAKATRMVGTPDLVIEIVSPTTEDKDTEWLFSAYHNAGIPEYWLIDARDDNTRFDIFKRGPKGYTASRKADGWVKSSVLVKSFRLTRTEDRHGYPRFTLEVR
jgi:Uma2 family endonuclease